MAGELAAPGLVTLCCCCFFLSLAFADLEETEAGDFAAEEGFDDEEADIAEDAEGRVWAAYGTPSSSMADGADAEAAVVVVEGIVRAGGGGRVVRQSI